MERVKAGERQAFCERNFKLRKHDVRWFDVVGMVPLGEQRRARLELVTCGTQETYEALEVRIVNKTGGIVERKTFRFNDHVEKKNGRQDAEVQVIGYCGWRWYCDTEPVLDPLLDAIDAYISVWE